MQLVERGIGSKTWASFGLDWFLNWMAFAFVWMDAEEGFAFAFWRLVRYAA